MPEKSLKQVVDEIDAAKLIVARGEQPLPPASRAGFLAAVNNARAEIKVLEEQYSAQLLKNSVAIFITGDAERYPEIQALIDGESSDNVGIIDVRALASAVTTEVWPTLSRGDFTIVQKASLKTALSNAADACGFDGLIRYPNIEATPTFQKWSELYDFFSNIVKTQYGELNLHFLKKNLAKLAIGKGFSGTTFGVIVINPEQEYASLFGSVNTVHVDATTEISKNFIESQLKRANAPKTINNKKKRE